MYSLSRDQKISNYRELIEQKRKKVLNLQNEIQSLERKLSKLEQTVEGSGNSFSRAISTMG